MINLMTTTVQFECVTYLILNNTIKKKIYNWFNPAAYICACPKPRPGFPTPYVVFFLLFICLRWLFVLLIIRSRKLKKDTQYNGPKKNDKQNNTQKTKDQATRTPLKTGS